MTVFGLVLIKNPCVTEVGAMVENCEATGLRD